MKTKCLRMLDKLCVQAVLLSGWVLYALFANWRKGATIKDLLITFGLFVTGLVFSQLVHYFLKRIKTKHQKRSIRCSSFYKPEMLSVVTTFIILALTYKLFFCITDANASNEVVMFFAFESTLTMEAINILPELIKSDYKNQIYKNKKVQYSD